MIKKLQQFLRPERGRRSIRRQFNSPLLDKQREDVFVLMHQQKEACADPPAVTSPGESDEALDAVPEPTRRRVGSLPCPNE